MDKNVAKKGEKVKSPKPLEPIKANNQTKKFDTISSAAKKAASENPNAKSVTIKAPIENKQPKMYKKVSLHDM